MISAKRGIAFVLALFYITATLSCTAEQTTDDSTNSIAENTPNSIEQSFEEQYADCDYSNGDNIVTIASYDYDGTWKVLDYTVTLDEENGDVINDAIVKRNRTVEELLGVELELFMLDGSDRNSASKLTTLVMAGDDTVDFAMYMAAALPSILGTPDMLVNLEDITTLDLSNPWWNQDTVQEFNLFGTQYAVSGDINLLANSGVVVTYFNKQLAVDLGLGDMYQLVYDGEWTLDCMIELSKNAARDLNGNGEVDIFEDQFGFMCEKDTLQYLFSSADIKFVEKTSDSLELAAYNERAVSLIEKAVPFFHEATTTIFADNLFDQYPSAFADVLVPTFTSNRALFMSQQLLVALNLRDMDADFGILPMPKADIQQNEYYNSCNTWFFDNVVVPVTNSNLKMTGDVLEVMGYYSSQYVIPAFVDATIMNKSIRDEDSAKMIELVFDTQTCDIVKIFDWGGIVELIRKLAETNSTAYASEYAKIEQNVISEMEKTVEAIKVSN